MTNSLLKSSKRKQKLYEKFLKRKTYKNEKNYKAYKNLFEKVKKQSKFNYYSECFRKAEGNSRKTWTTINEIIGHSQNAANSLPNQLNYKDKTYYQKPEVAECFNDFFASVGTNLASKIPATNKNFLSYLDKFDSTMSFSSLTPDELEKAFKSLKSNKSPGIDEIDVNVIKEIFDIIKPILQHIFNLSILEGKFPDELKIAKVTPVFKAGDKTDPGNYRPISVLSCLSKILEKIMYNRLYDYLTKNNILFKKQFGFQKNHSTEHALLELISEISESFENSKYTIGVFIDLSKAFDTVNHDILISKLRRYGITGTNLDWFKNYLTNRKQRVTYDGSLTKTKRIVCGVPQGSILGPLLFLIYVNDLYKTSKLLDFILFADDTNLFYSHTNLKTLFETVNIELKLVNDWFIANKLSLNAKKTKYILFCKKNKLDDLPLRLPNLSINNKEINRVSETSFLGVIIHESLSWHKHINIIENKISKNIGVLYKAKPYLDLKSLRQLYFAFINSYLNYCNIVWASTYKSNLKKLFSKQKHACRIIFHEERHSPVVKRLKELKALDVYQLNIYQTLTFMQRVKKSNCPTVFDEKFSEIQHRYNTRYSENAFKIPKAKTKVKRFSIRYRGPFLWNNVLNSELKEQAVRKSSTGFKKLLKSFLVNLETTKHHF